MAVGETAERSTQKHRRKMPSFSSSLLDSIYHSIDEPPDNHRHRRNAASHDEIESLRRAIMIEKWMENYSSASASRHLPSNSASSTDSSSCIFTASSETDSSTPRLARSKSKKPKEPISPGGRIANFLNSIFSPKKEKLIKTDWNRSSVRKSRSMKDATNASRPCLINTTTSNSSRNNNKSKRSVRFNISSNILDEQYSHGHGQGREVSVVGSRYIKKNMESIRLYEKEMRDSDDKSCASSDLFELDNIGSNYESELPVYATTNPPFSTRN